MLPLRLRNEISAVRTKITPFQAGRPPRAALSLAYTDTIFLSLHTCKYAAPYAVDPVRKRGRDFGRAGADCLAETHACYAPSASVLAWFGYRGSSSVCAGRRSSM